MKHALKTRHGRAAYIKSVMNFRQFLLRELAHVSHAWTQIALSFVLR